ncbi:hypothetical protein IAU59_007587 [Kwoniella sp. CBS 9459]
MPTPGRKRKRGASPSSTSKAKPNETETFHIPNSAEELLAPLHDEILVEYAMQKTLLAVEEDSLPTDDAILFSGHAIFFDGSVQTWRSPDYWVTFLASAAKEYKVDSVKDWTSLLLEAYIAGAGEPTKAVQRTIATKKNLERTSLAKSNPDSSAMGATKSSGEKSAPSEVTKLESADKDSSSDLMDEGDDAPEPTEGKVKAGGDSLKSGAEELQQEDRGHKEGDGGSEGGNEDSEGEGGPDDDEDSENTDGASKDGREESEEESEGLEEEGEGSEEEDGIRR